MGARVTTVGAPVSIPLAGAFTDPRGGGLSYSLELTPAAATYSIASGNLTGTPTAPGVVRARVIATDARGDTASQAFHIAAFAPGLPSPTLPTQPAPYAITLPPHYAAPGNPVLGADNTPAANPVTNAGATLGRVLFYDPRLSANDTKSCGSCHIQSLGFADTARLSHGFNGGVTGRHSMALGNARFYAPGRFFWDERAVTLEDQVLRPIQDPVEMGLTLEQLRVKVEVTPYYPALFLAAFGTSEVTTERISRALAQFVRSMVSVNSRFDSAFAGTPVVQPGFLTAQEEQGRQLFNQPPAACARCHGTAANISDRSHNTGLDAVITDAGAGNGLFKAPSLRNVAVRQRFMHDGRFTTLDQVIQFYDSGIQGNPGLDPGLRVPGTNNPIRLNLTAAQRAALVAYLNTLTDSVLLTAPRFSNPFP